MVDGDDGIPTSMTWGVVAARSGRSRSRRCRTASPPKEIDDCKAAIKAAADSFVALVDQQGYRVPFKPGKKGFPWGSNSFVLNNAIIMALAVDITGDAKYVNAVAEGMNYILGRNPLDKSYVTGYGERPLQNPHHRFWAHQANAKFPSAPRGRRVGRSELGPAGSLRPGGRAGRLRAAEVLRRQHRGLVGQRDGDQLERAARLGGGVPRREGQRQGRGKGAAKGKK